jgi:hypothetical protein
MRILDAHVISAPPDGIAQAKVVLPRIAIAELDISYLFQTAHRTDYRGV